MLSAVVSDLEAYLEPRFSIFDFRFSSPRKTPGGRARGPGLLMVRAATLGRVRLPWFFPYDESPVVSGAWKTYS